MFHRFLLFVFGLCTVIPADSQAYYTSFQTYGTREGFNAFKFSGDIVKDKKGFVWIGSDNGLYRFDGQNFKVFHHDPNDSFSLPSDNVLTLFIERNGDFWINDGNTGICRFDSRTEEFKSWKNSNNHDFDISKYNVQRFFQDSKF